MSDNEDFWSSWNWPKAFAVAVICAAITAICWAMAWTEAQAAPYRYRAQEKVFERVK